MGCAGSKAAGPNQLDGSAKDSARPDAKDAFMLAERFFGASVATELICHINRRIE
jgi:hypothetical protein